MDEKILELLKQVQKPGRYIGGEHNSVNKPWDECSPRVLLAFPDIYEVGMSYLGMRILYGLLNERGGVLCERVFSPWPDMEKALRSSSVRLFSLESKQPIDRFDIIGFSLAYELNYTNVLNILDLGGIPRRSADRSDTDPLIIAGGPSTYNPEPMAQFIDAFVIGDGEEAVLEIVNAWRKAFDKENREQRTESREQSRENRENDKKALLKELAKIEGVYVPSLYDVEYNGDGTIRRRAPIDAAAPTRVRKRVVWDLDACYYPTKQVVPFIQIVHDRIVLEIMRGCKHLCKFCQAGVACRPRRERSVAKILELAKAAYDSTGYEEISLVSLSSGDHTEIKEIFTRLHEIFKDRAVSVSMPSLRIEDIAGELPQLIKEVRKAGLTFAPESGSARLRKIINKDIDTEKLLSASVEAYKAGWKRIKLYFMIGLPGETEEDLAATAELARRVSEARRDVGASAGFVTASIAPFVPKPHTPFQWHAMEARRALEGRQAFLRGLNSKRSKVKLDFHDLDISFLEGVFSRGDRRAGDVIEEAWRLGARLDSWREYFNMDRWMDSFARCGIDPAFYVHRGRPHDEPLPWDFIDLGMPKDRLVTGSESF